MLQDR